MHVKFELVYFTSINQPKNERKMAKYRIQNENGTFLYAGMGLFSGIDSWFTLEMGNNVTKSIN